MELIKTINKNGLEVFYKLELSKKTNKEVKVKVTKEFYLDNLKEVTTETNSNDDNVEPETKQNEISEHKKDVDIVDNTTKINDLQITTILHDDELNINTIFKIGYIKQVDIKESFGINKDSQFRLTKNLNIINAIKSNFDLKAHFEVTGSFAGLPIINDNLEVIAGNHRTNAIKNLNDLDYINYFSYAKQKYNLNLDLDLDNKIIFVRFGYFDSEFYKRLAILSNKERLNTTKSEKIIIDSQIENINIDKLLSPKCDFLKSNDDILTILKKQNRDIIINGMLYKIGGAELIKSIENYKKDNNIIEVLKNNVYLFINFKKLQKIDNNFNVDFSNLLYRIVNSINYSLTTNTTINIKNMIDKYQVFNQIDFSIDDFFVDCISIGFNHCLELQDGGLNTLETKLNELFQNLYELKFIPNLMTDNKQVVNIDLFDICKYFIKNSELDIIIDKIKAIQNQTYINKIEFKEHIPAQAKINLSIQKNNDLKEKANIIIDNIANNMQNIKENIQKDNYDLAIENIKETKKELNSLHILTLTLKEIFNKEFTAEKYSNLLEMFENNQLSKMQNSKLKKLMDLQKELTIDNNEILSNKTKYYKDLLENCLNSKKESAINKKLQNSIIRDFKNLEYIDKLILKENTKEVDINISLYAISLKAILETNIRVCFIVSENNQDAIDNIDDLELKEVIKEAFLKVA